MTDVMTNRTPALSKLPGDRLYLPGDPGYDDARRAWNLAIDQRPAAVFEPESTAEVADAVGVAVGAGLRVAVQTTGHAAGPLGDLTDTMLLRTRRMQRVTVDPARRVVRAQAGVRWGAVVEAVAPYGLTVLHGSSPSVGVVGYTLHGGIGWYARALGLAAHHVTAAQLVTPDGTAVRVTEDEHPELLWGLRGGGGNVGIVTELEFRAFDVDTAYAGVLAWDVSVAEKVLGAWSGWAATAPREVTTSFRIISMPPLPALPPEFRGRRLVMIDGAVLADDDAAREILAPLRALDPEVDTFDRTPTAALARLHMDPEDPAPFFADTVTLDELPPAAVAAFLRAAGPDSGSSLFAAELRQIGGVLAEPQPDRAAQSHLPGRFVLFAVGVTPDDAAGAAVFRDSARLVADLAPWTTGGTYLNFAERPGHTAGAYTAQAWERLRDLHAAVDPDGVLNPAHPVTRPRTTGPTAD